MAHGEGETTLYCAFNFPGVLQTVGASRWDLLKDSYMVLVKDVQWKVRRSLSHSLHEVAAILGREYTEECLCEQVFDVFIKDLDEVRVGALKNFAGFMKVLSTEKRKTVRLPLLRCESEHACRTLLTAVPVYAASSTWRC